MSSSSTATLPLPAATPHLRAVRSAPSGPSGFANSGGRPVHSVPPRVAPPLSSGTIPPVPQSLLAALPEGATVVAGLPQGTLPEALLAQYGAQFGGATGHPMVGYLVLVPAKSPAATVHPVQPAGRGVTVDTERRNAYVDGQLLDLTYLEFELLAHLVEHPQRVHTRDHLVSAVWGYGHIGDGRTVDVHVARLRRKLGSVYRDSIVTVRRVGYKYTPMG
ncbi:winged helix-turn-helix transcriptional regulator [Streptomyces kaniharaensis]|uniref:Winged helix-turn-helix transcriptional regulator n=1 Tax=Streptomyces kaniharaensis TaxID=212423 RepID=A0A6N7KXP3_9ACTN|nr:winged helix-turn-helix domain-containing protein [Streptomyces kaniharaensis]MQS15117.1 winged helix-turn-helix transcriptional regulator [Streptomyces kaniharaensis]